MIAPSLRKQPDCPRVVQFPAVVHGGIKGRRIQRRARTSISRWMARAFVLIQVIVDWHQVRGHSRPRCVSTSGRTFGRSARQLHVFEMLRR